MHKSFYASGFLYSLKTHQILLLQSEQKANTASLWTTLGGESKRGEDAQATFQRIVHERLNVNLKTKHIYPIYDYFHDTLDKVNYVFYAEVKSPQVFNSFKKSNFSWVAFKETIKLLFPAHTKQDVIVGERVINAKWRLAQGLQ
ncbi:NUDIX hydrolase [Candidatus Daviesbacteria bacterium]|nr:NUDIX hydrolase [Candidatus Daviesbacteria bacterium]